MIGQLIYRVFGARQYLRYEALRQFWLYGPKLLKDPEQYHLQRFIRMGDYCLDVGANLGVYTFHLAYLAGPQGRVDAFEPFPDTFAGLRLASWFQRQRQVHLHAVGLDAKPAWRLMTRPLRSGLPAHGRSRMARSEAYVDAAGDAVSVEFTTVDVFVKERQLPRIDFIKMDVEGAELSVLRGARQVIARDGPTLLLEVNEEHTMVFNYRPVDLIRFLNHFGYRRAYYVVGGQLREWEPMRSVPPTQLEDFSALEVLPSENFFFVHAGHSGPDMT